MTPDAVRVTNAFDLEQLLPNEQPLFFDAPRIEGDVFPDDPALRARIGLSTEPLASPAEVLVQACGACHNDVLDQSVSRARFNIDLGRLAASQRAIAIERLERSTHSEGVMPPPEFRQLSADARAGLTLSARGPDHARGCGVTRSRRPALHDRRRRSRRTLSRIPGRTADGSRPARALAVQLSGFRGGAIGLPVDFGGPLRARSLPKRLPFLVVCQTTEHYR